MDPAEVVDQLEEPVVEAFRNRDHDLAVRTITQHLARTAFSAMADIAPRSTPPPRAPRSTS